MSDLSNFVIDELKLILDKYGIEKTWRKILATHLRNNPTFTYILHSREFSKVGFLGTDLIRDLSIGDISVLYEFSVSYVDDVSRKSNGQYFTPDDVSIFMANKSKFFDDGIWLDPCSGIGNLSWHLVSIQKDPETFLISRIFLSDKDTLALLIARTIFTLSFQKKIVDFFSSVDVKNNWGNTPFLLACCHKIPVPCMVLCSLVLNTKGSRPRSEPAVMS